MILWLSSTNESGHDMIEEILSFVAPFRESFHTPPQDFTAGSTSNATCSFGKISTNRYVSLSSHDVMHPPSQKNSRHRLDLVHESKRNEVYKQVKEEPGCQTAEHSDQKQLFCSYINVCFKQCYHQRTDIEPNPEMSFPRPQKRWLIVDGSMT